MRVSNLLNKKFGRLTVVEKTKERKFGRVVWKCVCDCGKNTKCTTHALTTGNTKSCGCLLSEINNDKRTSFEYRNTKVYRLWARMIERCHGSGKNKNHKWYKEKNISVCDEWRNSLTFIRWALYNGFTDNHTIHRIDSLKNYCPNNCIIITKKEHYKIHNTVKSKPLSNNKSGYAGVYFNKNTNKYNVQLTINGVKIYLGSYDTKIKAHKARKRFLRK